MGVTLHRVRRFVIVVAVLLGLAYAVGIPAFLERDDDPLPPSADAIVVLAGSENRLPAAEALFDGGLAPTLVVSADRSGHDAQRAALCRKPPKGVVCIHAGPSTTEGEAQAVGQLVDQRNWDSLILVTSRLPPVSRREDLPALREREDHGARCRRAVVAERDRRAARVDQARGLGDGPTRLLSR